MNDRKISKDAPPGLLTGRGFLSSLTEFVHNEIYSPLRMTFCYNSHMKMRGKSGQAMMEYVLALCAMLAVIGAMWYLVSAARQSVVRTENLVSSDYP